jgi:hypothetical protein
MLGEKVLHSALPLLAARDYYAVDDNFALLPVRFGTNGVVCNREAIVALTERGVICREEVGRLEKCDLKRLLDSQASLSKMQFCRWKWEEPINKMLEKASRKLQSPDKFREQVLHLFNCEVDDWNAMASKLKEEGPVVILGPSEMLAAPINSEANQTQSVVDWFLVKDAELLWVETIACLPEEIRESGHKEDVAARRSNWLVGAALRLMADPWEAVTVKEGEYWGYPVLGWSVCSRDGPQKDKAVEAIRQIVGPERVKRFRGGNPGEWMSNFLMEAGLSLRESPPRSIPIVRQRVAYAV